MWLIISALLIVLAIVVNIVQIGVLFAFVLYVLTAGPEARESLRDHTKQTIFHGKQLLPDIL